MNEVNFSGCKFSTAMVPYMYGELPVSERSAFESHLLACSECTDEFADLSNARYEVYDWKKLEFDPLDTPAFEIPYELTPATAGLSLIDRLRAAFGGGWAVPGFAFAGLAIVSIFAAIFVSLNNGTPDVAANITKATVITPAVSEQTAPPSVAPASESKASVDGTTESKADEAVAAPVSNHTSHKSVIRSEKPAGRSVVEPREASAGRARPKVPTLNDPVEDEDTSLRLAELFEDVETSD
jgi:hypothetical protein